MSIVKNENQAYEHAEVCGQNGDYTWWEYDAQGIELCRVCDSCVDYKLSKYSHATLHGYTQADVDEPVDPEEGLAFPEMEFTD